MKPVRLISCWVISFLCGIILFLSVSSIYVSSFIMSPGFHKSLIVKHNLYGYISEDLAAYLPDTIKSLYNASGIKDIDSQNIDKAVNSTITAEFTEKNLSPIVDGLFGYITGNEASIPDIDIKPIMNAIEAQKLFPQGFRTPSALHSISLSSLLSYVGMSGVVKSISFLKALYFCTSNISGILIPLLISLLSALFYLCRAERRTGKYVSYALISCGTLLVLSAAAVKFLLFRIYQAQSLIPAIYQAIPKTSASFMPYIADCLNNAFLFFTVAGFIILVCAAAFGLFSDRIKFKIPSVLSVLSKPLLDSRVKRVTIITFVSLLALTLSFNAYSFGTGFTKEGLSIEIPKLRGNTSMRIIEAKDAGVYTLAVKVTDKKSNPMKMIDIIVEDKTSGRANPLNNRIKTDENGDAKCILGKGIYTVSFDPVSFPQDYEMPSLFAAEIKVPGTTEFTITLDSVSDRLPDNLGNIEVEIIDEENNPVDGIELSIRKLSALPVIGNASNDAYYSISNSNGTAVFRVSEGRYEISFSDENFRDIYKPQKPFNVRVTKSSNLKYTIQLVKKQD